MGSKLSKPVVTAVDAPGPLTTFPLFRKLPIEIRRMIWKHSLPGERFLEFVGTFEPGDLPVSFIQCKDKDIPHMIACHESRAVAREEYVEFRPYVTGCPPMYVSPKLDIFCFAARCLEDPEQVLSQARDQISIKRVATQFDFGGEFPAKDCRTKFFPNYFDREFTNFSAAGLWDLELDELILISDEQELYPGDPAIVGIKDGWSGALGYEWEWLENYASHCKELMYDDAWVAPILRMGKWVLASPSEFSHDDSWVDKAWKSYGKGVLNGTIDRRETDDNDWEAYFGS